MITTLLTLSPSPPPLSLSSSLLPSLSLSRHPLPLPVPSLPPGSTPSPVNTSLSGCLFTIPFAVASEGLGEAVIEAFSANWKAVVASGIFHYLNNEVGLWSMVMVRFSVSGGVRDLSIPQ